MGTPNNSQTKTYVGGAARRRASSQTYSTIAPMYEHREIVVAQGIEFQNHQLPDREKIPEGIARMLPDLNVSSDGTATYTNQDQRVHFTIRRVDTKSNYKAALETGGLHVIYDGHARYGRGPCFGPDCSPGEDWGNGSDLNNTGLWRIAFPYLAVPVSEILEHQYTTSPVIANENKPPRSDCHPDIRARYGRLRRFTLEELAPAQSPSTQSPLASFVSGNALTANAEFWGFDKYYHGRRKRYVVLHAGWENTATDPMDLGGTDLQCRVFCHFGCSTFKHNYPVLRNLAQWRRTETERFAYWTTAASHGLVTGRWIYYLLTYRRRNAFQSWYPSLQYAMRRMRRYLRGRGFRII